MNTVRNTRRLAYVVLALAPVTGVLGTLAACTASAQPAACDRSVDELTAQAVEILASDREGNVDELVRFFDELYVNCPLRGRTVEADFQDEPIRPTPGTFELAGDS